MKHGKMNFKKYGAIFLACVLAMNWNLSINRTSNSPSNSLESFAAASDNDLILWYNSMAGTNFSGNAYDNNESFYKALPLGNGRIGAMVYGNYPDERIDLNECTFWSSGPGNNNKAGAANLLKTAQDQ
ncbi:MAG TPA: glycoside hydrolase N-terminal domain-containing protein [Pseudobacteroides sp.]|nr:glycoside hydrolase N-terminal domain-containing protein [Pseudobacteroides sp.]